MCVHQHEKNLSLFVVVANAITAEIISIQNTFGDRTAREFEQNVNHAIGLLTRYPNLGTRIMGNRRWIQINRQVGLIYCVNSVELKISKVLFFKSNLLGP